jgi:hypothetical protein
VCVRVCVWVCVCVCVWVCVGVCVCECVCECVALRIIKCNTNPLQLQRVGRSGETKNG